MSHLRNASGLITAGRYFALSAALALGCGEPSTWTEGSSSAGTDPSTLERASVRAAYIASRQREGTSDARYHVDGASLGADNPAQRFTATFGDGGVSVVPSEATSEWHLGLTLEAVGCGGR